MKQYQLKLIKAVLILLISVVFTTISAQKNKVSDPFFKEPYSVNVTTVTDKWIHVLNPTIVSGEISRVKQYGFADSIMYCKASYKVTSSTNRSACYITQRVTGLTNKKYRVSFWVNMCTKSAYLTSEVMYYNESMASETGTHAGTLILQTNSTTTANYLVPDNWTHYTYDVDMTGVTDLKRLQTVRLSFFPNCNTATTQARECQYFISEPKIYEITDVQKENIADGGFDSWNISGWPVAENNWNVNEANTDWIKRAPGHRDADFGFVANTLSDNSGSFIETAGEIVKIPTSTVRLSFYARAENANAEIGIRMKKLAETKTIQLTDEWKRYEVDFDYSQVNEALPLNDALQIQFIKANRYYIDECWMEQLVTDQTGISNISTPDFRVYQQASKVIVDGGVGYLQVFNTLGINMYSLQKNDAAKTELNIAVPGLYFVSLVNKDKRTPVQKIIVK